MIYRLTIAAQRDVEEIEAYVSSRSPSASLRLLQKFAERWALLATQPRTGRPRDDLLVGLRSLVVGQYVTFYYIESDVVIISRVLHGHRDISRDLIGG